MASPYSTTQSIVFVPTTPSPSNPHSIIPSSSSEGSPAVSQKTYLSPHSIIPSSSEVSLSSPASSSATTTRSPQAVSTGPDHPDSKQHHQQPVVYNAADAGGTPGPWSQSTNVYYPPPLPQYEEQGEQYAKATIEPQQHLQQQQPQQHYQQHQYQQQQHQQQQYQQYHQQQQPSEQSFPMYPVGHPNANDPNLHKPPIDTTRKDIIGGKKSSFRSSKKCLCLVILIPIILGIVLGVLFGVILKKDNNDSNNPPLPGGGGGGSSSGSSSSTRTTTTAGSYPVPTGFPDITNCVLACQATLTACTEKCGSASNMECQSGCFSTFTNCSIGCAGVSI
ncbi:hypothetical protein BGZ96_005746 [Linnemannia gamsii]|uniref:Uncharacterized protein n=1 Tax=Linnemannia gamsii TaxID=64522 RepID=A0ABQ7K5A3_9FUNG|nr:hypothetical protein BGZ96_005746 [Linnemannia gamsii]